MLKYASVAKDSHIFLICNIDFAKGQTLGTKRLQMTIENVEVYVCNVVSGMCGLNHYTGYRYFKDSVTRILEHDIVGSINKSVYSHVAEIHDTGSTNVERCLRTFIDRWWKHDKCNDMFSEKPTNKMLLSAFVELIQNKYLNEKAAEEPKDNSPQPTGKED